MTATGEDSLLLLEALLASAPVGIGAPRKSRRGPALERERAHHVCFDITTVTFASVLEFVAETTGP
jgi:hypothetical protein